MLTPLHELTPALAGQSLRVLIWDRDLVDMWCLDQSGQRQPYIGKGSHWHLHPEYELTMITRGDGVLSVGDHIGRFTAPDCLLLGAHVPHAWTSEGAMAGVSLQFRVDAASGLASLPEFDQLQPLWSRARHGLRWAGGTGERLREQLLAMETQPSLERLAQFIALIGTMRQSHAHDAHELSEGILFTEDIARGDDAMHEVLAHIMDHSSEEIRLGTVVRMSGLSQATFCRRFVRMTGKTMSAYVNAIRLQEVRRALLETDRSVTDIAISAGFTSLTNFYALFRRAVGCTPLAFRKARQSTTTSRITTSS
ncbi:MAG: helix-turn-helix transcriptional regulator [Planctomycetes bacterium]|nr:helix-turn-helix transcriptional regulator [Planctomycetota bacterium]